MTNQEAKAIIEEHRPKKCQMVNGRLVGGFPDHDTEIGRALDIAIEALEKTSGWIPCSERLPDSNGTYLITVRSYDETASIEYITVDHGNCDGSFLHFETKKNPKVKMGKVVTAWMELPTPYEGMRR